MVCNICKKMKIFKKRKKCKIQQTKKLKKKRKNPFKNQQQ